MSTLATEIRSRGHWFTVVRPAQFQPARLGYEELLPALRASRVQLSGWDFPHLGHEDALIRGEDWIGVDTDWFYYREVVRFTQSGQFAYLGGIREDWYERGSPTMWRPPTVVPGELLGLADTVTTYTEVFEFASRLATTKAGDETMSIAIELNGLQGRQLYAENPARMLSGRYIAQIPSFRWEASYSRQQLLANARELAVERVRDLFLRFGFEADLDVLTDIQGASRRV